MMGAVPSGDPSDAGTMMGPLMRTARDRVERYVQSAIDEGAKVVWEATKGFDRGFFYEPTLI